jgi:hypothetical protein
VGDELIAMGDLGVDVFGAVPAPLGDDRVDSSSVTSDAV